MNNCMLDYFKEAAGENEEKFAERTVKILAKNNIYTMDILMAQKPEDIRAIKGIGDRGMNLISRVMTKEEAQRKGKKDIYDKHCHKCPPTTLRDWFQKSGTTYLEACNIERVLRENGINSIDVFMESTTEQMSSFSGIGKKRLSYVDKTQKLIHRAQKQK